MVDFDLEKNVGKKIRFVDIFRSLFLYSVSLYLALWWKSYFDDIFGMIFPAGNGIYEKTLVGMFMTLMLVFVAWIILRKKE